VTRAKPPTSDLRPDALPARARLDPGLQATDQAQGRGRALLSVNVGTWIRSGGCDVRMEEDWSGRGTGIARRCKNFWPHHGLLGYGGLSGLVLSLGCLWASWVVGFGSFCVMQIIDIYISGQRVPTYTRSTPMPTQCPLQCPLQCQLTHPLNINNNTNLDTNRY
jgi:hypothetical protein